MGLCNDAIGYIVPDNDYVLGEFGNHYHELIGIGKNTGSTIINLLPTNFSLFLVENKLPTTFPIIMITLPFNE